MLIIAPLSVSASHHTNKNVGKIGSAVNKGLNQLNNMVTPMNKTLEAFVTVLTTVFLELWQFRESRFLYLMTFAAGAIIAGAIGEYIVESPVKDAKITSIGDAFWWAMATVTTVGYGDVYPVTTGGRIIASIVMIVGIAILGIFISTLDATLIESRLKEKKYTTPKLANQAKELIKKKIDELEKLDADDLNTLMAMIKSINDTSQRSGSS